MDITREQVTRFLDSLSEVEELPADAEKIAAAIQLNAQRGQADAKRFFGVELTADDAGVKVLDELLNAMRAAISSGTLSKLAGKATSAADANRVAATLGAFYGEILRAQSGGKWVVTSFQGKQVVALALTLKRSITPLHKVAKQFTNGEADSIWAFHSFVRHLARVAARVNNMSAEERATLQAKLETEREERKRQPRRPN